MKVILDIDSSQLGDTVIDLFQNLTKAQKEKIAGQILKEHLKEPYQAERDAYEQETLRKYRKEMKYETSFGKRIEELTDDELRDNYQFKDRMKRFVSTKEEMVRQVTQETIDFYQERVRDYIEKDSKVKETFAKILKEVEVGFPDYVRNAMSGWFASQMNKVFVNIEDEYTESSAMKTQINELSEKVLGYKPFSDRDY